MRIRFYKFDRYFTWPRATRWTDSFGGHHLSFGFLFAVDIRYKKGEQQ